MNETESSRGDLTAEFDSAFAQLEDDVLVACEKGEEWTARVAAGIYAAFDFAAREPAAVRVLTIDVLLDRVAGPRHYEQLIDGFARQLREARPEELRLTGVSEQTLVGAIVGLVRARVSLGEAPSLRSIAPQAAQFILAPYIGSEEANRIAAETGLPGDHGR